MITTTFHCYLCQNQNATKGPASDDYEDINCPTCGRYFIGGLMASAQASDKGFQKYKHRLSSYFREMADRYESTSSNYREFLSKNMISTDFKVKLIQSNSVIPDEFDVEGKILKFLNYLYRRTTYPGEKINVPLNLFKTLFYARTDEEFTYLWHLAENNNLMAGLKTSLGATGIIQSFSGTGVHLTQHGLSFVTGRVANSTQIFVAMAFNGEMQQIFDRELKGIIEKDTGYSLKVVADIEHNNLIDDQIIAEIKRSVAIIADFSHGNRGAYYEAGFAHALGKDLIFTCKRESFESTDQDARPHFDINHRNFIVWDSKEDLKEKLTNRINATLKNPQALNTRVLSKQAP